MPTNPIPQPLGQEFRIDATIAGNQFGPEVVGLADGTFLVAWQKSGANFTSGIFAQRFTAAGDAIGAEFSVGGGTSESQYLRTITPREDGGFDVYWYNGLSTNDNVFAQRFSASGAALAAEVHVDAAVAAAQVWPTDSVLRDGGFVRVEHRLVGFRDMDAFAQRSAADGNAVGEEFRVNLTTAGGQTQPAVAALADGGFIVAWQHADSTGAGLFARRFAADGSGVGGEFGLDGPADSGPFGADLAALGNGTVVATWTRSSDDGGNDIYVRLFSVPPLSGGTSSLPCEVEITLGDAERPEGGAGAGAFAFTVVLNAASATEQSVRWQVEGRGPRAADAADFEGGALPSGEIVFAAGETRKTVTVRVAGDEFVEADEGFALMLLSPSDGLAVGAHGSAAATILDDDLPASAPPAHAAKVARLYDAALDRSPDRGGFEFWVNALGKGEALSSLASGFLASEEFAARFGASADDAAFVERLYQNVLGRSGEAEGRAFWCDSLGKGGARAEVLAAFSESAEHVALTADLHGEGAGLLIA
ncbi:hypothetical protein GCM10009416_46220 [Craurococcus roseus]|uniref:Calx-beta domain-containing protein n=1 Tax=Craurococcus roseus TaxID=77585 RepID=A0ABP3R490_9PROT